jgi:hypothetical protein
MAWDIYIRQALLFVLQPALRHAYLRLMFAAREAMFGVLESFLGRSAMVGMVGGLVERDHVGETSFRGSVCSGRGLLFGGRPLVANIFEPVGSAVFSVQPRLAIGEASLDAATALWRVGAVEERNVLVSDVLEPADWLAMG